MLGKSVPQQGHRNPENQGGQNRFERERAARGAMKNPSRLGTGWGKVRRQSPGGVGPAQRYKTILLRKTRQRSDGSHTTVAATRRRGARLTILQALFSKETNSIVVRSEVTRSIPQSWGVPQADELCLKFSWAGNWGPY